MARRQTTARATAKSKTPEYINHICGDCGWGEFYYTHSNLDMKGKPICLTCPFTKERKRIRSEKACDKWKPKSSEMSKL